MAEGLIGGALGGEEENPEVEAPDALAGAEAFAAAVAAIASRQDPGVARKTEAFLDKQAQLLETQNKHLEEEHALRLTQLRHQAHLLRGQRLGQAIRIAFQIVIALIAIIIGIGIAVMLHDAFTSRSVVIEPFDTPPELAARGITGKVVANSLLDELTHLESATHTTSDAKRTLRDAWSRQVQLAVPETGVSIDEITHLLKARFGHDLHISGELVETQAGALALTVRGDGVSPKTVVGAAGTLDALTTDAADYVYSQAQPAQWALYLVSVERFEEAIAFARGAFARTDQTDRPRLLDAWAIALDVTGRPREALPLVRRAIALDPQYFAAPSLLQFTDIAVGDEEGAWKVGENMRQAAGGRPGRSRELHYDISDWLTWNLLPRRDALVADRDATAGVGAIYNEGFIIARVDALLHDPAAAELELMAVPPDDKNPTIGAWIHFVHGLLAFDAGDTQRAAIEMSAFDNAFANPIVANGDPTADCWVVPAEEAAGHPDKADAVLKAAGAYVDCYRFRGDILDLRDEWAEAQKAYTEAVALAPDLPAGYYSWGVALARHGDLSDSVAKLRDANQRGPNWADPLKAWGDVLVKQGKAKEALAKYDEALRYAPHWAALKDAREAAAKQKS
jgi:tetratricopeptide (TPR) repeat protein